MMIDDFDLKKEQKIQKCTGNDLFQVIGRNVGSVP